MNSMRLVERLLPEEEVYEPSPNSKAIATGRLTGHQRTYHRPHPKLNPGGRSTSIVPKSFRYAIFKRADHRDHRRTIIGMYTSHEDHDLEAIPLDATLLREGRAWSVLEAHMIWQSVVWEKMKNREYVKRHRARKRKS